MMISVAKYHGYGNDFLVLEAAQIPEGRYSDFAVQVCRNHFGVGADGCVFVSSDVSGECSARIFNQDGSEAGMSGNGVRCAAAFVHHRGLSKESALRFETISGLKVYELLDSGPPAWLYSSAMGIPQFEPGHIPFVPNRAVSKIEDFELQAGEESVAISALSVGNPQCVVFVKELPGEADFQRLGPALSLHAQFPEQTNVSFVETMGSSELRIRIWERGVGPTFSSGTGSCGAAVAAIASGRAQSPVRVSTETGSQVIRWEPGQEIFLQGEARFVANIEYLWP